MYLADLFRSWCKAEGLEIVESRSIPYGEQLIVSDGTYSVPVNIYTSGRGMAQGPPTELRDRIAVWIQAHATPRETKAKKAAQQIPQFPDRIGIDESGKGDYFGPLVVCAAFAKTEDDGWLSELGVKDSKKLADRPLIQLAQDIRRVVPHEIVVITPSKYNELIERTPNLNRLLAWGHARSLESLLSVVSAGAAISDQFGDRSYLERALMEKGRSIQLIQIHRAEEDMAVATASILARAEFLRRLKNMEEEFQMAFSKGASTQVETEAREFVERYGAERLGEVAKLHFKTTLRVLPDGHLRR